MSIEREIQALVAWADILLMTSGYILIRVIVVAICTTGIIIIVRRIRHGA